MNSPRNRLLLHMLFYLATIIVVGGVVYYLTQHPDVFVGFRAVPIYYWLLPVLIYCGLVYSKGLSFDILARVFGAHVPFADSMGLTVSSLLSNYTLPGNAGIAIRTLYMQKILNLSYRLFLPLTLTAFVFSTALYGIATGAFAFLHGWFDYAPAGKIVLLMLAGSLTIILLLLTYRVWRPLLFISSRLVDKILHGWEELLRSKKLLFFWLANEAVRASLEIGIFYLIAVSYLQIDLNFYEIAVMVLVKECSVFIRITPGALGVAEGVQAFFASAYGVDPAQIVFAGLVYRVLELISLAVLFVIFVPKLKKRIFSKEDLKVETLSNRN